MEEKAEFLNKQGEKLVGLLYTPSESYTKGIVLAHCFTCTKHIGIIRKTSETLAKEGFLVLRFDIAGNGESEGKFEEATYSKEMEDLDSAISFLASKGVITVGVIGHSMGAAVSILHSAKDERVKSLCVLGSPAETTIIKELFPKEKQEEIEKKGKATITMFAKDFVITKEFIDDAKRHSIQQALKQFKRPFCIIHGDNDDVVPVENAKKLFEYASEPKHLHIVKGADHFFSKQIDEVEKIIVDWFKETCVP